MKFYLTTFVLLAILFNCLLADNVKTISPCIAELSDGKRIDLTSLADKKTFR